MITFRHDENHAAREGSTWSRALPLAMFLIFGAAAALAHGWLAGWVDRASASFAQVPGFELWQMLVALELLSWACAVPIGIEVLRKYRGADLVLSPIAAGSLLVGLLLAPFLYLIVVRHGMSLPLNGARIRLGLLWGVGATVDAILLLSLMRTGRAARQADAELHSCRMDVTAGLQRLHALRSDLQTMLSWAGLILSLAVLATASLYHLAAQVPKGEAGPDWTRENVIGFGIYNTATLALAYVPASMGAQALAATLRERLCPLPAGGADLPDQRSWLKAWYELGESLQTDLDAAGTLTRLAPIVAPLLTGVLSLAGLGK
jgi:hypothetical protein